ncbi:hypothetical protein ABPG77_000567 [Micractinium sp. CCAP 211/92]
MASLKTGEGGLSKVVLTTNAGGAGAATATLYRHGATLTGWSVGGEQLIFVSPRAVFQPPKAIRGGVPVCFPQFGNLGPLQAQHGFARNREWQLAAGSSSSSATLVLESDEETLALWPHAFRAELTTSLLPSGALQQVLRVTNTDSKPLEFTCALHTYFKVSDIANASVVGLKGLQYYDNAAGALATDAAEAVTFSGEVDRAYIAAPDTLKVADSGRGAVLMVHKRGFSDAVVWNPAQAKAEGMADLGEHWRGFVCLEVAQARSGPVVLQPGEAWEGSTTVQYDTIGEGAD